MPINPERDVHLRKIRAEVQLTMAPPTSGPIHAPTVGGTVNQTMADTSAWLARCAAGSGATGTIMAPPMPGATVHDHFGRSRHAAQAEPIEKMPIAHQNTRRARNGPPASR